MKSTCLLVVSACTSAAPANPSFQLDVLPILAANCVRCHGDPPIGGAPNAFRLDTFGDLTLRDGEPREPVVCGGDPNDPAAAIVICGAASYAGSIALRTNGIGAPMPPRFPLDDVQVETLANWAKTAGRGAPREGNHIPSVTVAPTATGVRVRVDDDDGDVVAGEVRLRVPTGDRLVGLIHSGTVDLAFDRSVVAPGSYALFARVDDGAAVHTVELGSVEVP
jgi:hypothetical protein